MRRILVVDDDLHTRLAIRIWLMRCGFRVAIADGGVNGLAALDDSTFDLMIVDILMPNMRGFESIRVFHQRAPMVPLIAISGYAFSGPETDNLACLKMALSLGARRCLRKPFRPATLLRVIDECLSEAEPHRRYAVTLTAAATGLSERQGATTPCVFSKERRLRVELPEKCHAGFCGARGHHAGGRRRASASNQKMEPGRLALTEERWRD
jgi:CheY-like chemotaxis protein